MIRLFTVLSLVIVWSVALVAQRPVRVFVAPVEKVDGFIDIDTKRRTDSRRDLIENLTGDKTLTVVESAEQADLTLEVLSSADAETGEVRTDTTRKPAVIGGGAWSTSKKDTAYTVLVKLTAGDYTRTIRGHTESVLWREAAKNAGTQIKRWIKDNRAQLLAKNP